MLVYLESGSTTNSGVALAPWVRADVLVFLITVFLTHRQEALMVSINIVSFKCRNFKAAKT